MTITDKTVATTSELTDEADSTTTEMRVETGAAEKGPRRLLKLLI